MNETLTVFMISEIERLREEVREPARRIYHNMLRTLRESAGKEEIGFEEVTPVFLGKYEHWLLGKRLSWNTVSTYMRALRAGYNRGMKGRPGYVTGLFDKVYTGTRSDVKRAVDARTVGRMIRMSGCPDESASAKAVEAPRRAISHIQKTAPAPPAEMAATQVVRGISESTPRSTRLWRA